MVGVRQVPELVEVARASAGVTAGLTNGREGLDCEELVRRDELSDLRLNGVVYFGRILRLSEGMPLRHFVRFETRAENAPEVPHRLIVACGFRQTSRCSQSG